MQHKPLEVKSAQEFYTKTVVLWCWIEGMWCAVNAHGSVHVYSFKKLYS